MRLSHIRPAGCADSAVTELLSGVVAVLHTRSRGQACVSYLASRSSLVAWTVNLLSVSLSAVPLVRSKAVGLVKNLFLIYLVNTSLSIWDLPLAS